MNTLHIITSSPFRRKDAFLPLALADKDDAVLLMENGVVLCGPVPDCIVDEIAEAEKRGVKFFALREDLEARGLTSKWQTVDYSGAVELIFKYKRTV